MKTKRFFYLAALGLLFSFSFIACGDDDDNDNLLPGKAVSGITFTDTDLDELHIGGILTWTLPDLETNIDQYVIYLGGSATDKTAKLGEVNKGTTSFSIPGGTVYLPYILIVAKNATGESTNVASAAIADNQKEEEAPPALSGIYILNSGESTGNNSSLDFLDFKDMKVQSDVFKTKNGRGLGSLANDMTVYGSKLYIAVSVSQTIEVTDLEGKSLKQLKTEGEPRALVSYGGKVYATLFNGNVICLDTLTLELEKTVQAGRNPEQIVAANNKLYVANSGGLDYSSPIGYDKTVSVIDIATFTEIKKIEVASNPVLLVTDSQGDVYVASMGNYVDVPNTLQRIDTRTDVASVIEGGHASEITSAGDKLYSFFSEYDANWNVTLTYSTYDAVNEKYLSQSFLKAGSEPENPYKLFVDQSVGTIYIAASDYISNGDIYAYSEDGTFLDKWEVGLNPIKIVVIHP
jgi:hypothetical protein